MALAVGGLGFAFAAPLPVPLVDCVVFAVELAGTLDALEGFGVTPVAAFATAPAEVAPVVVLFAAVACEAGFVVAVPVVFVVWPDAVPGFAATAPLLEG